MGIPLSIGFAAWAERMEWERWRNYFLQGIGLLLATLCFFLLDPRKHNWEGVQAPRYFAALVLAHLWVALSPFLGRRSTIADFWEYNKRLLTHFVVGVVYSAIIFAGLAFAISATNALFDLNWSSKVYGYLFGFIAGIFQTAFFLYHFPKSLLFDDDETGYPVILKNLCQYVFVPVVGLYFLILYAYAIKIAVSWDLPRGWVSSLVLGFSTIGIFTYLVTYRLPDYATDRWVLLFHRLFWWASVPPVILLFVAIGRRILDYGVTPPRYLIACGGVWLLITCLYFLWAKKGDIRFIPASLAVFIVPAIIGPLSAFDVSVRSQTSILKAIFEENKAFESSGLLKKDLSSMPEKDRERVRSIVQFLSQQDALDQISSWFSEPITAIAPDSLPPYEATQAVLAYLHLEQPMSNEVLYLNAQPPGSSLKPIPISGFRSLYWLQLAAGIVSEAPRPPYVQLASSGRAILVYLNRNQLRIDTLEFGRHLFQWETTGRKGESVLSDSLANIEWNKGPHTYRLHVRELWLEENTRRIQQLNGVLLVK
ncbi:MAG: DUF4153 domain-containing protein [Saprospiraceae bacterium]|nr:DUF4153 domain-containing protein [Saprospiraceae bacterium]MDW8483430.1 DUF4153 domain-containing protein [Saprospiraceae bacterium]